MEIADCKLKIGNDSNNVILKQDVTPAEIMVLRAIHGFGSVSEIKLKSLNRNGKSIEKRSHGFELRRLRELYNKTPGGTPESEFMGGDYNNVEEGMFNVVNKLFPGMNPTMPIKFNQVEPQAMGDGEDAEEEVGEHDPEASEGSEAAAPVTRRRKRRATVPAEDADAATADVDADDDGDKDESNEKD